MTYDTWREVNILSKLEGVAPFITDPPLTSLTNLRKTNCHATGVNYLYKPSKPFKGKSPNAGGRRGKLEVYTFYLELQEAVH